MNPGSIKLSAGQFVATPDAIYSFLVDRPEILY